MGNWKALSLDSVSHDSIVAALSREGLQWHRCAHVTATGSLGESILGTNVAALPIATLMDGVLMAGLSDGRRLDVSEFPAAVDSAGQLRGEFVREISSWAGTVAGRRVWMSVEIQDSMRRFLDTGGYPSRVRVALRKSRRDLLASIQQLIFNGVRPELLECDEEIARVATEMWVALEREYPDLGSVREDLWIDQDEFKAQESARAIDLRNRILGILERTFGPSEGPRTLVHHGFFFYNSWQWAFFQLMKLLPEVDQIFIVHDDRESQVFESWRWFFTPKWLMPEPVLQPLTHVESTAAKAFQGALRGEFVDSAALSSEVKIVEFKNPAHFVNHWKSYSASVQSTAPAMESGVEGEMRLSPLVFAADPESIDKYVERLAGFSQGGAVDLALLPIGAYLRGLHNCIKLTSTDEIAIHLSSEDFIDVVGSGFLLLSDGSQADSSLANVFRRIETYFAGCRLASEWKVRATSLMQTLVDESSNNSMRKPGESEVERMKNLVSSPIRLAPWVDVTVEDAARIVDCIDAIVLFASGVASSDRVKLRSHVAKLQSEMLRGMAHLNDETRARIQSLMNGMTVGVDSELAVDDLVEVVNLLLDRSAKLGDDNMNQPKWKIRSTSNLDALGFKRHSGPVQVANLADTSFPSASKSVVWPFSLSDLQRSPDALWRTALEIMETREETSSASSLYLIYLAMNGVATGEQVTLSYIRDDGRESRNPSTILGILSEPGIRATTAVKTRAGGLSIEKPGARRLGGALKTQRKPKPSRASDGVVDSTSGKLPAEATSSAIACARRFALQWAAGPSPSFQSEHHHMIMFGNMLRRLRQKTKLVEDLWRHVTPGQRESSRKKAVLAGPQGRGANYEWMFTLEGKKQKPRGNGGRDPISRAYQAAILKMPINGALLAPPLSGFLPPVGSEVTNDVCVSCPVRGRCSAWVVADR